MTALEIDKRISWAWAGAVDYSRNSPAILALAAALVLADEAMQIEVSNMLLGQFAGRSRK